MKTQEIINEIQFGLETNKHSRIYFRAFDRDPVFGIFVALDDHKDLLKKSMVRFVIGSREEQFENSHPANKAGATRLININSLEYIKLY